MATIEEQPHVRIVRSSEHSLQASPQVTSQAALSNCNLVADLFKTPRVTNAGTIRKPRVAVAVPVDGVRSGVRLVGGARPSTALGASICSTHPVLVLHKRKGRRS
jgi:hypothetical protein